MCDSCRGMGWHHLALLCLKGPLFSMFRLAFQWQEVLIQSGCFHVQVRDSAEWCRFRRFVDTRLEHSIGANADAPIRTESAARHRATTDRTWTGL